MINNHNFKAIIFDFDGTILDTESTELNAWLEIFEKYDVQFPMEFYIGKIGSGPIADILIKNLIDRNPEKQLTHNDLFEEFRDCETVYLLKQEILPGVMEYLEYASRNEIKVAIASSSDAEWVHSNLDRLGIKRFFSHITTSDDVEKIKPAPDLFLDALKGLGVRSADAFVIEDSINGVRAAKAAGLFTIAVQNKISNKFDFSKADILLEKLSDLPVEEIFN